MSKYYKAKDVIRAIAENLAWNDNRINKGKNDCTDGWEEWIEDAEDVVFNLQTIEVNEEDELKFYYVDSIDDYWIGRRLDRFYYAEWKDRLGFVWSKSRYLPWGEHVVAPDTLWKEHTYPSEPREIPFTEWIVGFIKKHSVIPKPKEGEWLLDGRCSDCSWGNDSDYERAIEQMEHDALYEPTYNSEDGSM